MSTLRMNTKFESLTWCDTLIKEGSNFYIMRIIYTYRYEPIRENCLLIFMKYENQINNCTLLRMKYVMYDFIRRKGPSENRQEGEGSDNCIISIYVCIIYYSEEGAERDPAGEGRR